MSKGDTSEVDPDTCPACGNPVGCGMTKGETTCWCFDLPHRMPMPASEGGAGCYCRVCLESLIADQTASAK